MGYLLNTLFHRKIQKISKWSLTLIMSYKEYELSIGNVSASECVSVISLLLMLLLTNTK